MRYGKILICGLLMICALTAIAHGADASGDGVGTTLGTELSLDKVVDTYIDEAAKWEKFIIGYAQKLFWALAAISFILTFKDVMLNVGKSDLGQVFVPLVQWIIATGIFYWFLINGGVFAEYILSSFLKLSETLGDGNVTPMGVMTSVFTLWGELLNLLGAIIEGAKSLWGNLVKAPEGGGVWGSIAHIGKLIFSISEAINLLTVYFVIGIVIFLLMTVICFCITIAFALIAGQLAVRMIGAYVCAYIGIIVLGFGGAHFTRDIAIAYFKAIIGVGVNLLATIGIIGVGITVIDKFMQLVNANLQSLGGQIGENLLGGQLIGIIASMIMSVMSAIVVYELVKEVPPMLQQLISHHGGQLGGGAGMVGGMTSFTTNAQKMAVAGQTTGMQGVRGIAQAVPYASQFMAMASMANQARNLAENGTLAGFSGKNKSSESGDLAKKTGSVGSGDDKA